MAGVVVEESNLSVQIAAIRWILGQQPGDARWVETIPFLQDHWLVFMARMGFRPQLSCHDLASIRPVAVKFAPQSNRRCCVHFI